ncbi:MAG: hypothetical protein COX20_03460 [Desulfobacterales bacterium CG23_combo_of_CG06-09_8_20_14_all_52_9]|nr:MAG: hypothetical protein COX20_03460 [Desulfobacterales bacterium CG23_combo_of_CG06-09_8_20_14_all_52_9]
MTEKKEELLERLGDLRALSKKKKYRLARPEHDEVMKTLSSVSLIGLEGIKAALEALPDLPSDTGAEGVAGNWAEISVHLEEFLKALQGTRYKTELGKRLRLLIGQRLSSKVPEVAMRVILDVCNDMTPAKKEFPTSKDLNLINSTLLVDGASVLTRLPLDSGLQSKSVQLVSYCLGAGFSLGAKGKSLATPQTQLALIRWANEQPKFLNPGKEIQGLIAARIRDWNDDLLKLLGSELDALHPSLRDPINGALGKSTGSQSQVGSAVAAASVLNQKVGHIEQTAYDSAPLQTGTSRDVKDTYDVLYELGLLTNYIKQMNIVLNRSQEDVARLERDLRQAKVELGVTSREKEEAKRRCSVVEDKLAESLARGKKLEQSVNSHQDQIENLKSQVVGAENRHKETLESHRAHADELSMRIAQEGDHRLATFRNKLAGMLRPIAANLKEARSMEMTPELGIAMRTQLRQMLNILKSEGIAIDGDET